MPALWILRWQSQGMDVVPVVMLNTLVLLSKDHNYRVRNRQNYTAHIAEIITYLCLTLPDPESSSLVSGLRKNAVVT